MARISRENSTSAPVVRRTRPISFVLVSIAILFYVVFSVHYKQPPASVPAPKAIVVSKSTDIFTNEQMRYTETLFGERQEPLNVIFLAKNDHQLVAALQQADWVLTDKAGILSLGKAVKALLLNIPHATAPISPSFWNAKIQNLSFAKVTGSNG